jgi:hypothetical protein
MAFLLITLILTPKEYEKLVLKESMRIISKKSWMQLKEKKKAAKMLKKIYCRDIM